jgi:CheY-like chemotaxis protein
MEHLLFIDDERFFARQYSRELEPHYGVTICRSVKDGIDILNSGKAIDALILDIQMPTPPGVADYETRDGVDTGLWALQTYRQQLVDRALPILILTNRRPDEIEKRVHSLHFRSGQVEIFYKPDVSPVEFARRLTTALRWWAQLGTKAEGK